MGLAIARERLLWLSLSVPDQDKQVIMDSLYKLSQARTLFEEAVSAIQQRCDLRQK